MVVVYDSGVTGPKRLRTTYITFFFTRSLDTGKSASYPSNVLTNALRILNPKPVLADTTHKPLYPHAMSRTPKTRTCWSFLVRVLKHVLFRPYTSRFTRIWKPTGKRHSARLETWIATAVLEAGFIVSGVNSELVQPTRSKPNPSLLCHCRERHQKCRKQARSELLLSFRAT